MVRETRCEMREQRLKGEMDEEREVEEETGNDGWRD